MNTTSILPAKSALPSCRTIMIAIMLIIVTVGCSDKDDNGSVAPNGNGYDAEMMALIPAGTFRMGNITDHPDGARDEKPVQEVSITRLFLMSRTEVT